MLSNKNTWSRKKIGKRVKEIRKEKKQTLEKFSRKINSSYSRQSKQEGAIQSFTIDDIMLISKEYNVKIGWLLEGNGERYFPSRIDSELNKIIEYVNEELDSEYAKNQLLDLALNLLLKKIALNYTLFGEDYRAIYMFMEILDKVSDSGIKFIDPQGILEKTILDLEKAKAKNIFSIFRQLWFKHIMKNRSEHLLREIKALSDEETYILVAFAEEIIILLNKRFSFLAKLFFMKKSIRRKTSTFNFLGQKFQY